MIEERLPVGLVLERLVSTGPWGGVTWTPVAILPPTSDVAPWTALGGTAERMRYYTGIAEIHLYSTDTANYRDNLEAAEPKLWVVLGPEAILESMPEPEPASPQVNVLIVTADPAEGEAATEAGSNIVATIAMPAGVAGVVAAFIVAHHVERPVLKRRRDRGVPDVRWRHPPGDPNEPDKPKEPKK